jgi:hypothetical protein
MALTLRFFCLPYSVLWSVLLVFRLLNVNILHMLAHLDRWLKKRKAQTALQHSCG